MSFYLLLERYIFQKIHVQLSFQAEFDKANTLASTQVSLNIPLIQWNTFLNGENHSIILEEDFVNRKLKDIRAQLRDIDKVSRY